MLPTVASVLGDRYTIEREIGAGGMATVYLADDAKHHRKVAIKILRPDLAASIGAERFLREIEIAAHLNHPHILPLYDSGAVDDVLFYVMPFVRGETLRQRLLRERRFSVADTIAITRQIASALEFAHAQGVIHRDIKPENILLHEGEAMVADFGIALPKQATSNTRLTDVGLSIGTPDYMSPEQAQGDQALTASSDVYSLGCVAFEMLAGEPPHAAPTPFAVIAKRLSGQVPSLSRVRADIPAGVAHAITKSLALETQHRWLSAGAFATALGALEPPRPAQPSVAVLPFLNMSADPDNEYFADGVTEDVIAQLSKLKALKVTSRSSVMRFKSRSRDLREIASTLNTHTILDGSVRRAGSRVRIVAQLVDVEHDTHLWSETYDRELTDIFAIQSDVALHIASALHAELSRDEKVRIEKEGTSDIEAYQLYLLGRHCYLRFTNEGMRQGLEYYKRAVDRDAEFAMAHVALAQAYAEFAETGGLPAEEAYANALVSARKALELDPQLGAAHCVMGYILFTGHFEWENAEGEFKRAIELSPSSAEVYDLYGRMCYAQRRFDEAIEMQERARELDPLVNRNDLATAYLRAGRYIEALEYAHRAISVDPYSARARATAGWAYLKQGRITEGMAELEHASTLSTGESIWMSQLGQAYGMTGEPAKAREVLRQLYALAEQGWVSPYHFAYVYTGLADYDRAMDYLERAFDERSGPIHGIKGSFLFTALHEHPRFKALLTKMNLS
jgi:serine/threonine protein kinase/Flp pilus assembly protein TadD